LNVSPLTTSRIFVSGVAGGAEGTEAADAEAALPGAEDGTARSAWT